MIRLNLLKQFKPAPGRSSGLGKLKINRRMIFAGAGVGVFALSTYLLITITGSGGGLNILAEKKGQESPVFIPPEKPAYEPKVVLSYAVEEIVREIQNEQRSAPKYEGYRRMAPSARIGLQLANCREALSLIKNATPPEIGYTDFIFTAPGDLYLRGMATSKDNYLALLDQLRAVRTVTIKPGILKPIGDDGIAHEFSLYGTVNSKEQDDGLRIITPDDFQEAKSSFMKMAQASGLEFSPLAIQSETRVGQHKRYIYRTKINNCSYDEFSTFVNKLRIAKSKIGIIKFTLKADGDEIIAAHLDVAAYTN